MGIHSHPNADLEHIGPVYGFDLKCVRSAGRSDTDVASVIRHFKRDFDCFIVNELKDALDSGHPVIRAIAERAFGWVEVFGVDAEAIHDAVDLASVQAGRQRKVGDGNPMTSWNTTMDDEGTANYVVVGGQGDCELKLLVYFGTPEHERNFLNLLKDAIARRSRC